MHKLFFIVLMAMLLQSCGSYRTFNGEDTESSSENVVNDRSFKVLQVLENGVLAYAKTDELFSSSYYGTLYFIEKEENQIYYDDLIIKIKRGDKAILVGSYSYVSNGGAYKTVPRIRIIRKRR